MRRLVILLLLLPLSFGRAYAEEPEMEAMQIFDSTQMGTGLREEEREVSGEPSVLQYDAGAALNRLYRYFYGILKDELHASLNFAAELLGIVLLCAFSCAVCTEEKIRSLVEICAVCAAAGILLGGMRGLISQTVEAVYRLSEYSKVSLPVVYSAAAASGGASTAALGYAGACLALDVLMNATQRLVIPLVYATLCLTLANVVFPHPLLGAIEKLSKWAGKTVLTILMLAFTAYLGMSTLISRNADAAAVKVTRSVISGALPVVGGLLADASKAVLSAASVMLSCTGVFGLIAVCAICAGPIAVLSVKSFLLRTVSATAEAVQASRLEKLLAGVNGAMGMLMGILGACAVMLFLSFAAAMRVITV